MSGVARETTVMIVDDVPENLSLLSAILQKENYHVEVFTSGGEALQAAKQSPPDIILLDIMMPEMDGYQVCQSLKSDEQLNRIPVIFISTLTQVKEKVKGFEAGGQDYITKPFEVREVRERIRTHLDLAWTRRELEETLDQTLTGSIKLITDFMGLVNPTAFSRAIRIKQKMTAVVEELGLEPKRWFELAAVLSQFAPAALPQALQEKCSLGDKLSTGETEEIEQSVELVATMLKSIPRLESVAEMITHHKLTLKRIGNKPFDEIETSQQGGMILNLLQQYDQLSLKGGLSDDIVKALRKEGDFPEALYQSLQSIDKAVGSLESRCYSLDELVSGMILDEDIRDRDGRVLLKQGVKLSCAIVQALKFQQARLTKTAFVVKTEAPA
ncbi:MAG: response regulator [Planctomycetota bacterium]|jgi:DNA-binding response OmpR family regulator